MIFLISLPIATMSLSCTVSEILSLISGMPEAG